MQAAALLQMHVHAGFLQQLRGKPRPARGRRHRPHAVARQAHALALHPHQPEVAARRAIRHIAFVQHRHMLQLAPQAVGNRGAHQPAADHRGVIDAAMHGRAGRQFFLVRH
ncbi:hypothetical protein G6F68_016236 [Rhizopus microsporus]|nr:hypothetical protein G6F68_016236 [Rhizopus microsporus]KAG1385228.1 hypothetical protein G6F59_017533 [Rhizopus arrhizus]